jgi:hypothetical protein
VKYVDMASDVSKDHSVRLGHEIVRATLRPIAGAIYFADTNSIIKEIVGSSCMAVLSVHGRVFDRSPEHNKTISCRWRSRSDNFYSETRM